GPKQGVRGPRKSRARARYDPEILASSQGCDVLGRSSADGRGTSMNSETQTKPPLRILHLEDDPTDTLLISRTLAAQGVACDLVHARSRAEFEAALQQPHYDLILSDYTVPGYGGMSALTDAQEKHPQTPFIFLSGTIGDEAAV